MRNVDVLESDPFFTLLTDALRAGPGSPEWHQAVTKLRSEGASGRDEYKLLTEARAHLESGKDFRSVRAGADFTRRLLTRLEDEPAGRAGTQTANVIMIVSALAILGVLALMAALLSRGGGGQRPREAGANLATMYFPDDLAVATFKDAVPAGWDTIGKLPLHTDGALRPAIVPMAQGDYIGGGVVLSKPVPAGEPFALEAVVTVPEAGGDFLAEVFVSDSADFSEFRATAPNELVWLLQGAEQKVMVRGQGQGRVEKVRQLNKPVTVRLVVDNDGALVESRQGEGVQGPATVLWSGAHGLAADKPKYAGVRFIRGAGESPDVASVKSIRVLGRSNGNGTGVGASSSLSPRNSLGRRNYRRNVAACDDCIAVHARSRSAAALGSLRLPALRRGVAQEAQPPKRSCGFAPLLTSPPLTLTLTLSPEYRGEGTRGVA
jgi:hypothetical protein